MNAIERLLARVDTIPPNANGCRIWDGATDPIVCQTWPKTWSNL